MRKFYPLILTTTLLFAFSAHARIYCEVVNVKDPYNKWFQDFLVRVRDDRTGIQDMRSYGNEPNANAAQKRCQLAVGGAECLEIKGSTRFGVNGINIPNGTYETLSDCSDALVNAGATAAATEPPPPKKPKAKEVVSAETERELRLLENELKYGPKF